MHSNIRLRAISMVLGTLKAMLSRVAMTSGVIVIISERLSPAILTSLAQFSRQAVVSHHRKGIQHCQAGGVEPELHARPA